MILCVRFYTGVARMCDDLEAVAFLAKTYTEPQGCIFASVFE